MKLTTNWGYSLTTCSELADLLTPTEFNNFTANKYKDDGRIEAEIKAASASVRNYCGWHLYPTLQCDLSERILYGNGRIKAVGRDLVVQLPSVFVSAVNSVKVAGVEYTDYDFTAHGVLRVFDAATHHFDRKSKVEVVFESGIPASLRSAVKEIIAHRVTHALANSYGVASESAGGVSISYSQNWINSSRASALPDDNKEVLAPYKLQGVF